MSKKINPTPFFDAFSMIRRYAKCGFLDVVPDKFEVYITNAALATMMTKTDKGGADWWSGKTAKAWLTAIRAYIVYLRGSNADELSKPFAIHVVSDEKNRSLSYTILVSQRRQWWRLWRKGDHIDVITYNK